MELLNSGLLLVNKERGVTSFQEINRIRKEIGASKSGHAGTLDKDAEGLLLVCFGKATKLLKFLVGMEKTYIAEFRLGIQTTTDDAEGEVCAEYSKNDFSIEFIRKHLEKFHGKILQRPPNYSAIHVNGKRAYQLAKQGKEPPIKEREVTIHAIEIINFTSPILTLKISCSSGTYIRSIARDLGIDTGYFAHVCKLQRIEIGNFALKSASSFEDIKNDNFTIFPPEVIVSKLPLLELRDEYIDRSNNGQPILPYMLKTVPTIDGYYKLLQKNKLSAILTLQEGKLQYDLVYTTGVSS